MLVPGLMKLFVMKPPAIIEMIAGLGIPAAGFFAWVLIFAEIGFGAAIISGWVAEGLPAIHSPEVLK